jgi:hypothetical protein
VHEIAFNDSPDSAVVFADHAGAPPVGLVEIRSWLIWSAATQSVVVGHEIELMPWLEMCALDQDEASDGVVEVQTFPPPSTIAHSELDAHDAASTSCAPDSAPTVHAPAPPAGSLEVAILP